MAKGPSGQAPAEWPEPMCQMKRRSNRRARYPTPAGQVVYCGARAVFRLFR